MGYSTNFQRSASHFLKAALPGCRSFSTGSTGPDHPGHLQVDIDDQRVGGPQEGEKASEYLRRQIREVRVFVGFDVDDDGLGFAVQKAGREAFIFGSDFPHEVFNAQKCRKEIDELIKRTDLSSADKEAVLGGNARRFYGAPGKK